MTATTGRYPCPDCGSSDSLAIYEDHSYCFNPSCAKRKALNEDVMNERPTNNNPSFSSNQPSVVDINGYPSHPLASRKISKEVCEFFGVKAHVYNDQRAHFYPYGDECYKVRILPKDFRVIGKPTQLFGQREFTAGGRKLVITEGELDALSIAEAFHQLKNTIYPVVSIPSSSQLDLLLTHREWIRSFNEVILWMDTDEAGQNALNRAAKIIGFDKAKVVNSTCKDANETLLEHGAQEINRIIWAAQNYSPAGIVSGEKIWTQFQERRQTESVPYPDCLSGLNNKLQGVRYGEITLFTSGTGSGKSTVIKEIILDLLTKTDSKVGLISLEESVGDTAEKFIGMALNKNLMDQRLSEEELRRGFDEVFGDERLVLLDHQGSVGDSSLIDKIEYMALCGCRYLILDHITIAVSEGSEGLSGNEAVDKVMSDLLKLVKKHNVWLGIVSHLRKATSGKAFEQGHMASIDDIKGSGSIKQISFDIVAFSRNLTAETEDERNKIQFSVLKSRFTGLTGPAGSAAYDRNTGRLSDNLEDMFV